MMMTPKQRRVECQFVRSSRVMGDSESRDEEQDSCCSKLPVALVVRTSSAKTPQMAANSCQPIGIELFLRALTNPELPLRRRKKLSLMTQYNLHFRALVALEVPQKDFTSRCFFLRTQRHSLQLAVDSTEEVKIPSTVATFRNLLSGDYFFLVNRGLFHPME